MIEFLTQPWPWYFGGTMIAIVLFYYCGLENLLGCPQGSERFVR